MAAQWNRFDFIASTLAGVLLIGVSIFPTDRPDLPGNAPRCGSSPTPEGCTPIQQRLGEATCAHIHYACAVIALATLAAVAANFGRREFGPTNRRWLPWFHFGCAAFILLGLAIGGYGDLHPFSVGLFKPTYIAEVMAVTGFAAGWFVKGWALWGMIGKMPDEVR